jgi:asparagine synthase (glutamine-hydrolysing)
VEWMCAAQKHRGPDSRGVHVEGAVGLGIQRLRVIDLDTGDQPIYNEDRSVAVVLNGEIYNYRELRRELAGRRHILSTKGDTEVIAHLYEEMGPACVRELHGMFAFALWDEPRRRLLLARDRVGKKPLFYSVRDGALSFASELRALLEDREIPREVDLEALDCYLAYQYVPAPLSAFRAVRKLPPASTLLYEQGRVSIERYWRLRYDGERRDASGEELHEEIRERIRQAVRRRMISDVPLGAFLSGGIDSSTVVAAMAEASSEPVRTFSIGFEEEDWNELPNARLIADRFSTDHEELIVKPDLVSIVPKVARHYGEPFGDPSSVPSFYVAEMARRGVTVALNGDGGDESFAGYHRYVTATRTHRVASVIPGPMRRVIGRLGARSEVRGDPARSVNRARRLARSLGLDDCGHYAEGMALFTAEQRHDLYADGFRERLSGPAPHLIESTWEEASGDCLVNRMLEADVRTYLPDDLLVKVDVASMAYSLEARSPLLDHELMELAASLPGSMKIRGSERKVVLRDALRGWIPDQILDGPKRGFGLPMVGRWFRGELRDHISQVLTDPATLARGYFSEPCVRELLDRHLDGSRDNSMKLWALMMFEVWHREVVDQPAESKSFSRYQA